MYDELIKRLRICATEAGACKTCELDSNPSCTDYMMKQAADAIEELQAVVDGLKAQTNMVFEETEGRTVIKFEPKWIPVTEQLPEDGTLVGKLIADSDGCIRIASQCAVITLSGGKTVYTDLIDLVSFLAKDTPTTEWADCTHITHWMPLPEPPKEET